MFSTWKCMKVVASNVNVLKMPFKQLKQKYSIIVATTWIYI